MKPGNFWTLELDLTGAFVDSGTFYVASQISDINTTALDLSSPQVLLSTLQTLRQMVEREGTNTFDRWRAYIERAEFLASALNLAQYLALRRHDLRHLQAALMPWGLSSLGRIEARVLPNLDAVIATLEVICGNGPAQHYNRPRSNPFWRGAVYGCN